MVAIVLGVVLMFIGIIDIKIPGSYILTFVIFIGLFGGHGFDPYYLFCLFAGMTYVALLHGKWIMLHVRLPGQDVIFGIILGLLTGIFRVFGASAEGSKLCDYYRQSSCAVNHKISPKPFGKGGERR